MMKGVVFVVDKAYLKQLSPVAHGKSWNIVEEIFQKKEEEDVEWLLKKIYIINENNV